MPERPTPESFLHEILGQEGYVPEPAEILESEHPSLEPSHKLHWYNRFSARTTMAGILLASSGTLVLHEEPPKVVTQTVAAGSVPHTVYRTGGDGVWLHESPGLQTPLLTTMPDGATFNVDCFVPGQDVVNGNAVWLQGDYNGQPGSITDYYIDTHWNTTQDLVNQGIEQCGTQPAAVPAPEQPVQAPSLNISENKDDNGPYKTIGSCRGALWGAIQEACVTGTMGKKDIERKREWVEAVNVSSPGAGPGKLEIWGDGFYHTVDGEAEYQWKVRKWVASGTNICAASADSNDLGKRVVACYKINVEE